MQPAADYRLVHSQIQIGVMMAMKRKIFPKTIDHYFSSWLYGQRKFIDLPCLSSCSNENRQCEDFSLLTIDLNLFLRCLPLLNNEQLTILYSLLDDDQQSYQCAIREQYQHYRQQLIDVLRRHNFVVER